MLYQYDVSGPKTYVGCGFFLMLLGLVLVSPVVAWLIKAIGWVLVALGVLVFALGVASWVFRRPRRR